MAEPRSLQARRRRRATSPRLCYDAAVADVFTRPLDAKGKEIDLTPIQDLLERLLRVWRPAQLWLFGSRARGDGYARSDWDLFVVVPDDLPEVEIDPLRAWQLRKASRANADVIACHASEFLDARNTPNTMAYEVTHGGVLLYER